MVKILDNGHGSILQYVVNPDIPEGFHLEVNVQQKEHVNSDGKRVIGKKCPIRAQLEVIMLMNYIPGNILPGKIITKETLEQIEDDPEAYLKIDEQGNICRNKKGKAIYSYSYYTENHWEKGELL